MSVDRHDPDFVHGKAGKDNPEDHDVRQDAALTAREPEEPIPNPGLPPHRPRPTDVNPKLERRAELQVSGMFAAAGLMSVLFVVAFFLFEAGPEGETFAGYGASNLSLGVTLGLAMLLIGMGAIHWARKLMGDEELVEYRHSAASNEEDREEALAALRAGTEESGVKRRSLIRTTLLGSLALLGLPTIVLLRDLGPLPGDKPARTVWKKGVRVVNDVSGTPIRPAEIQIGQLINAEPASFFEQELPNGEVEEAEYEGTELLNEKAKAAVIVVRMEPNEITPLESRENWGIDGILCYSKICTHVGCPISLYEQQTHSVLCPCHQSTFDLADNGKVVFGPAARNLPQLPLGLDEEGYLIAMSDFQEPVGPSYWERG